MIIIKQVDEKMLSAVCVLKFLRFNAEITGTEVKVSWNQPFPIFFFNECVSVGRKPLLVKFIDRNFQSARKSSEMVENGRLHPRSSSVFFFFLLGITNHVNVPFFSHACSVVCVLLI